MEQDKKVNSSKDERGGGPQNPRYPDEEKPSAGEAQRPPFVEQPPDSNER